MLSDGLVAFLYLIIFGITPASISDINVLKDIAKEIHDTDLYADKAYISNALKQALEEQNASLNTPVKRKKGQQQLGS